MKKHRIPALTLAAALLLTLLTACKTPDTPPNPDAPSAQPIASGDTAEPARYVSERLSLPLDARVLEEVAADPTRQIFAYRDGRIYLERYTDTTESGVIIGQTMEIFSVRLDGKGEQPLWSHNVAFETDEHAKMRTFETVYSYAVDDGGNLWLILQFETQDNTDEASPVTELRYEISKFTADGTLVGSSAIDAQGSPFSVRRVPPLFDADGNTYVLYTEGADAFHGVFDAETAQFRSRNTLPPDTQTSANTRDGAVAVTFTGGDGKRAFQTPDIHEYAGNRNFTAFFPGFGEWDILFADALEDGLYGYSFASGREEKLLSFVESGVTLPKNGMVNVVPSGGLVVLENAEFLVSLGAEGLRTLRPSDAPPKEKVTLTVALSFPDGRVNNAAMLFNMAHDDVKIVVKAYNDGMRHGSYADGIPLDLDIMRGDTPDIIGLINLSASKYINKGLLVDMMPYLENDTRINQTDLFENVLALCKTGDKLYHIVSNFGPEAFVGKKSLFGDDNFTMAELSAALAKYPDAELIRITWEHWIQYCMEFMMDELVDWNTGTCNFNSPDFIALLESVKRIEYVADDMKVIESTAEFDSYLAEYSQLIDSNKLLLIDGRLPYSRSARSMSEVFGDDWAYLGFPSEKSGNILFPQNDFAIMESCEYKDEAWEFISMLLRDESISMFGGYSINRNVFNKGMSEEMVPVIDRFPGSRISLGFSYDSFIHYEGFSSADEVTDPRWLNYHLTEAEVATVREAVENITVRSDSDPFLLSIIFEEAEGFRNGARTAEETARIIQSRVSIYVAEQAG